VNTLLLSTLDGILLLLLPREMKGVNIQHQLYLALWWCYTQGHTALGATNLVVLLHPCLMHLGDHLRQPLLAHLNACVISLLKVTVVRRRRLH
jgi:hypothetical protein